jgi:hypothetical protein
MSAKPKPMPAAKAKPKAGLKLLRKLALALPETFEAPHFEMTSFRVNKGKIFATAMEGGTRCMIKLTPALQEAMSKEYPKAIAPVPGLWGANGSTHVFLDRIKPDLLADLLVSAWLDCAPKKLAKEHAPKLRKA